MVKEHGGRMLLGFSGRTRCCEMEERKDSTVWFGDASERRGEELGWCFAGGRREG